MMRKLLNVLMLLAVVSPCCWAQVNQQAIKEVEAGKLKQAKASWWGFDPVDATACLQAAINSKVPRLIVDNVGKPWIVTPITLVSNQQITFQPGVEVLAKANEFHGSNDSLFNAYNLDHVSLIGYGATLRMRRSDYADPTRYKHAEWRHVLNIHSCSNLNIYGLVLAESGGDGIYLGADKPGVTNKNIHIKDVICDKNYRQGISVITADNLLIENTIMRDTAGTAPMAGIDFEPNNSSERISNCVLRNCTSENNDSWGYVAYLPQLKPTSAPVGLRLENCKAIGNKAGGFGFTIGGTKAGAVHGQVELLNCQFTDNGGSAFSLGGNPPPPIGCQITVQKCSFLDNAVKQPIESPIAFSTRAGQNLDIGGVRFNDVVVRDPVSRPPMVFSDVTSDLQVADITGNLILEKNGQQQDVQLTKAVLSKWMPIVALKKIPPVKLAGMKFEPLQPLPAGQKYELGAWRLRKTGRATVWAKQGQQITLNLKGGQVGRYATKPIPVVVTSPAGKQVAKMQVPFAGGPVTFTAPQTGLYSVTTDAGNNYTMFTASTAPFNFAPEGNTIHFISSTGTVYFCVPAGTKEFGIRIHGEGLREAVKATLINPAGKVVAEKDNIARVDMLTVEAPQPLSEGVWSLKLDKASKVMMEDYYLDPLGIPPLLAPAPADVLRTVR